MTLRRVAWVVVAWIVVVRTAPMLRPDGTRTSIETPLLLLPSFGVRSSEKAYVSTWPVCVTGGVEPTNCTLVPNASWRSTL